jgi:hypothetical protein
VQGSVPWAAGSTAGDHRRCAHGLSGKALLPRGGVLMSVDRNKAVVRRFHEELFNQQNLAIASEILDQDIHAYGPAGELYLAGRDAYLE